ncbi:MAG: HNH endonuclease [Candidatus Binatia bacterium]
MLALIEAGVPHVCAEPGCGDIEALTVDHVVALSRGGTDDLSNLRFLCRVHNSRKRDR